MSKRTLLAFAALFASLGLSACGGSGEESSAPPPSPPTVPTVSLAVNPTSVATGAFSTLTWSSTDATSCTASGAWSGAKASSGGSQTTGPLTASGNYSLTCTGSGGSASASATVSVSSTPPPPPIPTVSLAASPTSVAYNASSILTWSSTNATSCTASGAWLGDKTTSGNESTGALTASGNYSLTCTGSGGSASASVTVSPPTATLVWDAVTDANLSGYRIYYGTQSGTYIQVRGEGLNVDKAITTYTVTGLSSGTQYYFAATAYDTMGNESDYSNEVFKDMP